MPKNIRLSGTVTDSDSKNLRKLRAELLYHLFMEGYNIYNGNGDQDLHLWNIHKKIVEASGFVFLPGAKIADLVNATSIFVGYQTGDIFLNGKPTIVMNPQGSWDDWLKLIDHLHALGTVSQDRNLILTEVTKVKDVVPALNQKMKNIEELRTHYDNEHPRPGRPPKSKQKQPDFNVCVFCSASTKKKLWLKQGYELGQQIAEQGWGCVSGAGRTGIMGEVVRGAKEAGGWSGGSNIPHIIKLEGLPDGLDAFWPTDDIYQRMEVMMRESNAFIVMPGGMGTVQEFLVLLQLKAAKDKIMKGKPIVMLNGPVQTKGKKKHFWDPLIAIVKAHKLDGLYTVVDKPQDIIPALKAK